MCVTWSLLTRASCRSCAVATCNLASDRRECLARAGSQVHAGTAARTGTEPYEVLAAQNYPAVIYATGTALDHNTQ